MTRITDRKIPCVCTHVYHVIKNRGAGSHNSLRHANNRKYFPGLTRKRREAGMFYLAMEVEKIWWCSCWEKGNFIMINEFKYGQTWKIWQSPLSLSLYSTFKSCIPQILLVPFLNTLLQMKSHLLLLTWLYQRELCRKLPDRTRLKWICEFANTGA